MQFRSETDVTSSIDSLRHENGGFRRIRCDSSSSHVDTLNLYVFYASNSLIYLNVGPRRQTRRVYPRNEPRNTNRGFGRVSRKDLGYVENGIGRNKYDGRAAWSRCLYENQDPSTILGWGPARVSRCLDYAEFVLSDVEVEDTGIKGCLFRF